MLINLDLSLLDIKDDHKLDLVDELLDEIKKKNSLSEIDFDPISILPSEPALAIETIILLRKTSKMILKYFFIKRFII